MSSADLESVFATCRSLFRWYEDAACDLLVVGQRHCGSWRSAYQRVRAGGARVMVIDRGAIVRCGMTARTTAHLVTEVDRPLISS